MLYKKGKVVKNPQTGLDVELPGSKMGTLVVTMSIGDTPETEISFCTYNGEELSENELSNYYILEK